MEIEVGRTYRLMDPGGRVRKARVLAVDHSMDEVRVEYPEYDLPREWVPLRWFNNG